MMEQEIDEIRKKFVSRTKKKRKKKTETRTHTHKRTERVTFSTFSTIHRVYLMETSKIVLARKSVWTRLFFRCCSVISRQRDCTWDTKHPIS